MVGSPYLFCLLFINIWKAQEHDMTYTKFKSYVILIKKIFLVINDKKNYKMGAPPLLYFLGSEYSSSKLITSQYS